MRYSFSWAKPAIHAANRAKVALYMSVWRRTSCGLFLGEIAFASYIVFKKIFKRESKKNNRAYSQNLFDK